MTTLRRYLSLCLAFALISCGKTELKIVEARFGIFTKDGTDKVVFTPTERLSKKSEAAYGWFVKIQSFEGVVTVKDEVETPVPAKWEIPANSPVQISADGKTVSATQTLPVNGTSILFHNWSLSSSDPVGSYKNKLYVNSQMVKEVSFAVVE